MGAIEKHVSRNEVAVPNRDELAHVMDVVRSISGTDFVPKAYRNNNATILACILTGRGLGLDPLHALRSIYVVDGKPTLSAELMVTLARRAGHSITGNFSAESVTLNGKRGDNGDEMSVTWTFEMAKRAGLVGKDNWKKYPEAMLHARAASQLCRMLFADVLAGVSYTPDEAELSDEERVVEAVSDLPIPADDGPDDSLAEQDALDGRADSDSARGATVSERGSSEQGPGMAARTSGPSSLAEEAAAEGAAALADSSAENSRPALAADIDAELEQESFPIPDAVKGRSA